MNLSSLESLIIRQRSRQWSPLITQQQRLRHVSQIFGLNFAWKHSGSFYFTLHSTTMCAPFYTSEQIEGSHPKWAELDLKKLANTASNSVVLRVWQNVGTGKANDEIRLTMGVNFSGLVYIGNKIAYIQPCYFQINTIVFCMQGGFFTSQTSLINDVEKPLPFAQTLNVLDTGHDQKLIKHFSMGISRSEIQKSYNLEMLRKLKFLQVSIRNQSANVQHIIAKINANNGINSIALDKMSEVAVNSSPSNVRYAPQLLTMNSLNKMLHEKPNRFQKQQMLKLMKQIEVSKYNTKLLAHERDKKLATIRQLRNRLSLAADENEEKNNTLMENYHQLNKEIEKLKAGRLNLVQHSEILNYLTAQLSQRRRQLMQELLLIYPIERISESRFKIHDVQLPNSDILPDFTDLGVSVALGYVAHIQVMCSSFLQVPLRHPVTHCGSRSIITDELLERDKDFPLFSKGKDKGHFLYAVYLLNKNIAQLRWLFYLNTDNLKATLPNLLNFLQHQSHRDPKTPALNPKPKEDLLKKGSPAAFVCLNSFGSSSNIHDPILDCIRKENKIQRSSSPNLRATAKNSVRKGNKGECGPGLGEILAIPEAFLNRQISTSSFRNYVATELTGGFKSDISCGSTDTNICDINNKLTNSESIEQGTDLLNLLPKTSQAIQIATSTTNHNEDEIVYRRKSRSVGSYPDEEERPRFELGSDPLRTDSSSCNPLTARTDALLNVKSFNLVKPKL